MINRTLVRTKIVQTLFAYYKDEDRTTLSAKKEMLTSFSNTYSLYMLLLDLVNEITTLAEQQIEKEIEVAKVRHEDYVPNYRFQNNLLAQQLFNNRQLRAYLQEEKLCWDAAHESVRLLWRQIQSAAFYKEYMTAENCTYEDDKAVWRHIFTDILADNDELGNALDELELVLDGSAWTVDANVVISYIIKTIKLFKKNSTADQDLLQMFDQEEELVFANQLLKYAIDNRDEYELLIEQNLKGWDLERISYMDRIILLVALAEIINFPNIALQVSMNEYIELSKEYSGDKSYQFINGILDRITQDLVKQNKLIKAVAL